IEAASPNAWKRIQERRRFMIDVLGIRLSEDILPTSDIPGVIFPYLQDLSIVIAFEG
ncbi:MAG: Xaa-Pro aminopeptidase, partial [Clostridiales bacterium]|nr:Xaa-Pro aminopeptidase [Clostridiales bacterium]